MIIINADDFGLTKQKTDAIIEAYKKGYITDTTMVVNTDSFEYAASKIIENHLEDSIGLHFNLTEGKPLSTKILDCEAFTRNGYFHNEINRNKKLTKKEKQAVYEELEAQAKKMKENSIHLTHCDSHHHIHTAPNIYPIFLEVCKEYRIHKVRITRNIGNIPSAKLFLKKMFNNKLRKKFITTDFFGMYEDFDGNKIGNTEIMVHPDYDEQGNLIDVVDNNRPLIDVYDKFNDFQRMSYREL